MSLTVERRRRILDAMRLTGGVRVSGLAADHGVSEMTIRRDLDALVAAGHAQRVHGGAVSLDPRGPDSRGHESAASRNEWAAMARVASSLVFPGMAVSIAAGSLARPLALLLMGVPNLSIVTNSMAVADLMGLRGAPDTEVFMTGGSPLEQGVVAGPLTVGAIARFMTDISFMSAPGIDDQRGVTFDSVTEADVGAAYRASTRRLVVAARGVAVGSARLARACHLAEVDVIVTTDDVPPRALASLSAICDTVLPVGVAPSRAPHVDGTTLGPTSAALA